MKTEIFGRPRLSRDDQGVSHLTYTLPQGIEHVIREVADVFPNLSGMRPVLLPTPHPIGKRNRTEWCLREFRVGARYNNKNEKVGGFVVCVELRDFGSECPPKLVRGTWPDRLLYPLLRLFPSERLVMLSCYTPEGFYVGDLDRALTVYGAWKLTDVQPVSVANGGSSSEAIAHKLACAVGYDPKGERWVGWSHRGAGGFGIGHVVEEGNCEAESLPIGFEVKTTEDAKRCAVTFAEAVG